MKLAASFWAIALLTACNAADERETDAEVVRDTTAANTAMPGRQGMEGGMMTQMMSHMQTMQAMTGDSMKAMLPRHRQMADSMLAQMNRERHDMNLMADTTWNALADSVRNDMMRMPGMSGPELQTFLPQHGARMTRLMESHQRMMESHRM
ncbi:MAG TPA: hypothetical protein VK864_08545 [Longimicrobiales bacterium]|nr:hypothetical protein [Longimicrobiales bacterium]